MGVIGHRPPMEDRGDDGSSVDRWAPAAARAQRTVQGLLRAGQCAAAV